jgi:hypothetical protein
MRRIFTLFFALLIAVPLLASATELPPLANFDAGKLLKAVDLKAVLENILDLRNFIFTNVDAKGAIEIRSRINNHVNPTVRVADLGGFGILRPGGHNSPGIGLLGMGSPSDGDAGFSTYLVNTLPGPISPTSDAGSAVLRIDGWKGGDTGIEITAGGTNQSATFLKPAWNRVTDALGKISFFGMGPDGQVANDNVRVDARADQNFTQSEQGSSIWIDTMQYGQAPVPGDNSVGEITRWGLDSRGNMALGAWAKGGNNFPGGGLFIMKDAVSGPDAPVSGGGILSSRGGAPYWYRSGGTGNQPMVLQNNDVHANDLAVWDSWGMIRDGGSVSVRSGSLCIGQTCLTEAQLQKIIQLIQ